MKKALAVIVLAMVAALAFALVGCGGSSSSASSTSNQASSASSGAVNVDEAVELNWSKVWDEYLDNEARAKQDWNGKLVKYTATVYDITDKYAKVANETYKGLPNNSIDVYLSTDDLVKLNDKDEITVVGTLDLGAFTYIMDASLIEINGEAV